MSSRRIPSLNWLRVFEAAARTESFARAAEVLNMSPSAVSQQIRALEMHLSKDLFVRQAKRVLLTDTGRAFLPVVQHSLSSMESTASALFGSKDSQHVTIQVVSLLAMGWLPGILGPFEKQHPSIQINLITANLVSEFHTIIPGRDPDLQIAFGSASEFPEDAEPLFGEKLSIVAHSDLIDRFSSERDILSHRLFEVATHRSGWHQLLASTTEIDLEKLRLTMVDNTPVALMMAAEGLGLAIARSPASNGMVKALSLESVDWSPTAQGLQKYYMITPSSRPITKEAILLREWIIENHDN